MILKRDYIYITLFFLLLCAGVTSAQSSHYASSSVLKEGQWVKIAVLKTGVYKLTYSEIKNMGFSNPAAIALYGNNTGQLSFYNDGTAPDDLRKIAMKIEKGSDGIFNEGDYIMFYAEGTHRWNYNMTSGKYEFSRQYYSDTAFYFLTAGPDLAAIMHQYAQPAGNPSYATESYDFNFRSENEQVNIINSGREWYQQVASGVKTTVDPQVKDVLTGENISYRIRVLARSVSQTGFTLNQGTDPAAYLSPLPIDLSDINGLYASVAEKEGSVLPASSTPVFNILFNNNGNGSAIGYIDFAELRGRASLKYSSAQLIFSDSRSISPSQVSKFNLESQTDLNIWDVTDPFNPETVKPARAGNTISFLAVTDSLRKYVAFTTDNLLVPVIKGRAVANQDLHAMGDAEMIIVTHPLFMAQAQRLAAIHSENDGIRSVIVTPGQIYNEFSGGIPDAAAIRNFVRMIWEKGKTSGVPLKYLLLFGDGSYENKTPPPGNTNFIPTWQSVNSNTGVLSFTSDDFYGLLEDGEGESDGSLEVGIGRFPVDDTTSAGLMVRKVKDYISTSSFGSWRNIICMLADDEDDNLHMIDSEDLSKIISEQAPAITNEKIYLDSYRQVTSISGDSYPDVTAAVNTRVNAGCLIFNYVGHASESGFAHERVVGTADINSWKNRDRLPLFITATCEFSRFDNVSINSGTGAITANTSAGEMVLLNPDGGGIGLMSTTRVVYSAPNHTLNSNIIRYALRLDENGLPESFGNIIRLAKNDSGEGTNKRNFLLLGDPALRLALPSSGTVVTDSINSVSATSVTDTLKALSVITVKGHINGPDGKPEGSFNGTVEPTVFDKPVLVTTLANDGGKTMKYYVPGNVLFKGPADVTDGYFSFTFMVPHDINYSFGNGSVKYYANNENTDLNGYYNNIVVGGFSDNINDDNEGPDIRLFMNDTLFREGGITDNNPILLARLSDKSGINASGAGIGHDITAWFDNDISGTFNLNALFRTDKTGYKSGTIYYPFTVETDGEHSVTLRAWDNLNNFSEKTLKFRVNTDGRFRITRLECYPNPASEETKFSVSHNRPGQTIDLRITIFSSSGNVVRVIKESVFSAGYTMQDIPWDGCNSSGAKVAGGIYIWRVEATAEDNEKSTVSARVIIL